LTKPESEVAKALVSVTEKIAAQVSMMAFAQAQKVGDS